MSALTVNTRPGQANQAPVAHSVRSGAVQWHVLQLGSGPACLLLHGTGASSHSWRALMPLLAQRFTVYAVDLPGHGRTSAVAAAQMSLQGMAAHVRDLIDRLELSPLIGVGHSAGAAILVQLGLHSCAHLKRIVSINGALVPFGGIPGIVFPRLAQVSAGSTLLQEIFTYRLRKPQRVNRLLADTGSAIDYASMAEYHRLCQNPSHIRSALTMMANWRLSELYAQLHRLQVPILLIASEDDPMVPLTQAYQVASRLPGAHLHVLPGGGHLVHESQAERVATCLIPAVENAMDDTDSGISGEASWH